VRVATTAAISGGQTKVEWTVGAGIEGRINAAYTVKLEYLYIHISSIPVFAALPANARRSIHASPTTCVYRKPNPY
jgi:opacity protein-like surface antigen